MDDKILASILHLVKASHPPTCEECRVEHVSEKEEETRNHSTAHPPREVRESHRHTEEGALHPVQGMQGSPEQGLLGW